MKVNTIGGSIRIVRNNPSNSTVSYTDFRRNRNGKLVYNNKSKK